MAKTLQLNKIHWDTSDPATPALVDALIEDMGVIKNDDPNSLVAAEATKRWCISEIQLRIQAEDILTMGELNVDAFNYFDGYLDCLNDIQRAM